MDNAELLARVVKAREIEIKCSNGWVIRFRLPTEFEVRRGAMQMTEGDGARTQVWMRDLIVPAVVGWSGPTVNDVLGDGDATALPYAPALVKQLLEDNLAVFDEIAAEYGKRIQARAGAREAALKN